MKNKIISFIVPLIVYIFLNSVRVCLCSETCVTKDELCAKNGYQVCRDTLAYSGQKNRTKSGKACQQWSSQTPHEHTYGTEYGDTNYCRNPSADETGMGPWCYTTDPETRWEYCFEDCPAADICVAPDESCANNGEEECRHVNSYSGEKHITKSGKTCQQWSSQTPHVPAYGTEYGDTNYCRNPSAHTTGLGPWCYTTDPDTRWEYCFEDCPSTDFGGCVTEDELCAKSGYSVCRDFLAYSGEKSVTKTGKTCQQWGEQTPHEHTYGTGYSDTNYCRNPSANTTGMAPWCYTTDPETRWEYCFEDCPAADICVAADESCAKNGQEECRHFLAYYGMKKVTKSGKPCQKWNSQTPHEHTYGTDYGDTNYCRNPSGHTSGMGPWCYTTDPDIRWEYCFEDCPTESDL